MSTVIEGMNHFAREAVDRRAIRELIDAWAHHADRRRPTEQAALFTADGTVSVYAGGTASTEAAQCLQGHAALADSFKILDNYEVTTHFNGQSTIMLDGDRASGETYCLAHHIWTENGQRTLLVISIRYLDQFVREDGMWRFADRRLIIDWTDQRPSSPGS